MFFRSGSSVVPNAVLDGALYLAVVFEISDEADGFREDSADLPFRSRSLCGDLKGRGSAGFDPFEALLAFVLEVRYRSVETLLILIVYRPMSGIYLIEVVGFESV